MKEKLSKIKAMWFSGIKEDSELAKNWLIKLVGETNAIANLFVLTSFHNDSEDWTNYRLDERHYVEMDFKTYSIRFGKDYRYRIYMLCVWDGKPLVSCDKEYSRYDVGNDQPQFDFACLVCDKLRAKGVEFYNELFYSKTKGE